MKPSTRMRLTNELEQALIRLTKAKAAMATKDESLALIAALSANLYLGHALLSLTVEEMSWTDKVP